MIDSVRKKTAPGAAVLQPLKRAVDASLAIPGSKSLANRAILLAGVAEGTSILTQLPDSDDIRAALSALSGLGVDVDRPASGGVRVWGRGLDFRRREGDIDIRSSGTVGRFLPGLLAAAPAGRWRLVASSQLAKRPLDPLVAALRTWGATLRTAEGGLAFPLEVGGGGLAGGEVDISARASSQFASGLLLAAPLASRPATVVIRDLAPDEAYIDMTLQLMRRFGVEAKSEKNGASQIVDVPAPQKYRATDLAVEADFNSANYFLALPLLVGGSLTIANLSAESGQPGRKFLAVLERLGGRVEAAGDRVKVSGGGLPLRGGFILDMRAMSEMALTLGVLAVFADAPVTMTNLEHVRGHETDRLSALAESLAEVGVACEQGEDWIRVIPPPQDRLKNAVVDSRDDHRLAMSFSLLALGGNGLTIRNPGAVAKTFPEFFERLGDCGAEIGYTP